jgi:hypothetical protein
MEAVGLWILHVHIVAGHGTCDIRGNPPVCASGFVQMGRPSSGEVELPERCVVLRKPVRGYLP